MSQERIAFENWLGIKPCGAAHDLAWAAWQARASLPAPQQATPEPLPEHADHVSDIAARLRLVAKLAGVAQVIPDDDRIAVGAIFSVLGNMRRALERKQATPEPNPWREAVEDELTILHASMPTDPREAVKKLVALECQIALDPDVSQQAAALVQRGRDEAAPEPVGEPLTDFFVQTVPDKCDRIVWRGQYIHLSNPRPAPAAQADAFTKSLDIRAAQGWKLTGNVIPVLYTDSINGEQVCRDDVWLCTTDALKQEAHAAQAVPMTEAELIDAQSSYFRSRPIFADEKSFADGIRYAESRYGITAQAEGGA